MMIQKIAISFVVLMLVTVSGGIGSIAATEDCSALSEKCCYNKVKGGEFQEDFDDLDDWYLVVYDSAGGSASDPAPQLDTSMGQPAPSLDVNGDSWCGNGAYTKETFDYTKGLAIEFDMYVASGYDWNWGWGGLSDHLPNLDNPRDDGAYVDPTRCDPSFVAGIYFTDDGSYDTNPPSLSFRIRAEDETTDAYTYSSDASQYENEWHTYKIGIQPDGYVEFYMDGALVWTSTKKIDETLGSMPLVFGSRDTYGPVRIDNVKVCSEWAEKPSIEIYTDKTSYKPGDTMTVTIGVKNPTASSVDTYFVWYFYWMQIMATPYTLPPNFDQSYEFSIPVEKWVPFEFDGVWYVALLETTPPYKTICEDTAEWKYELPKTTVGEGETTPAALEEIGKEIKKTVERAELPGEKV